MRSVAVNKGIATFNLNTCDNSGGVTIFYDFYKAINTHIVS
jgi:hypothetical protein